MMMLGPAAILNGFAADKLSQQETFGRSIEIKVAVFETLHQIRFGILRQSQGSQPRQLFCRIQLWSLWLWALCWCLSSMGG